MRIPLVSLKPASPGNTESEKSGTKKKSLKDNSSENGVTTCKDDKNLVIDAWQAAVTAVSDMVWNLLKDFWIVQSKSPHSEAV